MELQWIVYDVPTKCIDGRSHNGCSDALDYPPMKLATALEIAASLRRAGRVAYAAPAMEEDFQ